MVREDVWCYNRSCVCVCVLLICYGHTLAALEFPSIIYMLFLWCLFLCMMKFYISLPSYCEENEDGGCGGDEERRCGEW